MCPRAVVQNKGAFQVDEMGNSVSTMVMPNKIP